MVPKKSTRTAKNAAISEATPQPDSPSLEQSSEPTNAIPQPAGETREKHQDAKKKGKGKKTRTSKTVEPTNAVENYNAQDEEQTPETAVEERKVQERTETECQTQKGYYTC